MPNKLMKSIRRQLLKIDWFSRKVDAYRVEQKKKRHKHNWDLLMNSGQVRNLKPEKLDPNNWLISVDCPERLVLVHRISGTTRTLINVR